MTAMITEGRSVAIAHSVGHRGEGLEGGGHPAKESTPNQKEQGDRRASRLLPCKKINIVSVCLI